MLNQFEQRATYGAVGGAIGQPAQSVGGLLGERNHHHSWVVNAGTGLPTGYAAAEMHPNLADTPNILNTTLQLLNWCANHQALPE